MTAPNHKELHFKDVVRYEDGCVYWVKPAKYSNAKPGDRAGSLHPNGYRKLSYRKIQVMEHRVIWMLHHGEIPDGLEIDHINRNKADNRIENLRLATSRQNAHNIKKRDLPPCVEATTSGRLRARVSVNGSNKLVGTYDTIQEAIAARDKFIEAIGSTANCI